MSRIEIIGLRKTYTIGGQDIRAVDDVSLKIEKGEFVSIVGHSGSGKTTLLSLIGGIVRPTSGKIFFDGADIFGLDGDRLSEYRCGNIGFMFQFSSLLPILTSKENLLLPVIFSPDRNGRAVGSEQRAVELLKMVGLGDKLDVYPSQLSGGQQRRVAIARAFMNEPEVILADEPTGDLDEETEAAMMSFFRRMNEERRITFIMVTHNTALANNTRRLKMINGSLEEL